MDLTAQERESYEDGTWLGYDSHSGPRCDLCGCLADNHRPECEVCGCPRFVEKA